MSEYNEEGGYTLAHCMAYRIAEGDKPWCLLIKTVDGKVDYLEMKEEPVLKWFIGMAADADDAEQHRIVAEGALIDPANLTMFHEKKDY